VADGGWGFYASVFAVSAVLSLVLTPFAVTFATKHGLLDRPGAHKAHESPVPYLGGLVLVGAFSLAVLVAALVRPPVSGRDELVVLLVIALGLSVVGLLDDLRGLGVWPRILCEVAAGAGLYAVGAGVQLFQSDAANAIVTIVWVVGITNAFNLLDNMDGLSAGVAAIAAGSILLIAATNGQFLVAGLAAGTAGCAVGFLRHNFHPARIYMGDSGSLFLGVVLAYLAMKLRFDGSASVTFLVPIMVLGVAIFDTTLVTVCRLAHRRSPFQGGRDHTSHRLVALGIPVPLAVTLIYVVAALFGGVGLLISRVDDVDAYILAGLVVIVCLSLGVLLSRVPVYDLPASTCPVSDGADRRAPADRSSSRSGRDLPVRRSPTGSRLQQPRSAPSEL
jgi:UDP-GlcNAc:undecaprenyl-phosphate GlcNAc-1-phosphate transferase